MKLLLSFLIAITLFSCSNLESDESISEAISDDKAFKLGNEVLLNEEKELLTNKRIGLITNNSGVLSDGSSVVDAIASEFRLIKIFTPEHGLRGDESNVDHVDQSTGAYVVSLYGNKEKPNSSDLSDIDVLVYDLQDVSARFYTFINTLYYCMEAAAENDKKVIVCDRPIIPDGNYVDGFVLEDRFKSFAGLLNIPAAYAMTCGEMAKYINSEYLSERCDLQVVKMKNYSRDKNYDDLGLYWKTPSPNMYFPSTAVAYLGTCIFEGTNFAEGRGSQRPFEYVGAPYCNGNAMAGSLNAMGLKGVTFEAISFTPRKLASWLSSPKYLDKNCEGVYINITDRKSAEPFKIGIAVIVHLRDNYPAFSINSNNFIDKLAGTDRLRSMLNEGKSYEEIVNSYSAELNDFKIKRQKYLMY